MAASKKSAKRSTRKKSSQSKRPASKKSKKKSAGKSASRTRATKTSRRTGGLQRKARKGIKAAREGFDNVLEAGGKTWDTLKATTAQVVGGVKETLAGDAETGPRRGGNSR